MSKWLRLVGSMDQPQPGCAGSLQGECAPCHQLQGGHNAHIISHGAPQEPLHPSPPKDTKLTPNSFVNRVKKTRLKASLWFAAKRGEVAEACQPKPSALLKFNQLCVTLEFIHTDSRIRFQYPKNDLDLTTTRGKPTTVLVGRWLADASRPATTTDSHPHVIGLYTLAGLLGVAHASALPRNTTRVFCCCVQGKLETNGGDASYANQPHHTSSCEGNPPEVCVRL
jgi:hypothetical protein